QVRSVSVLLSLSSNEYKSSPFGSCGSRLKFVGPTFQSERKRGAFSKRWRNTSQLGMSSANAGVSVAAMVAMIMVVLSIERSQCRLVGAPEAEGKSLRPDRRVAHDWSQAMCLAASCGCALFIHRCCRTLSRNDVVAMLCKVLENCQPP